MNDISAGMNLNSIGATTPTTENGMPAISTVRPSGSVGPNSGSTRSCPITATRAALAMSRAANSRPRTTGQDRNAR